MTYQDSIKKLEVENYLDTVNELNNFNGEIEVVEGLSSYKISKIDDNFSNIISNIKKERDNIHAEVEIRKCNKVDVLKSKRDIAYKKITEFNKKIEYLKQEKEIERTGLRFNEKEIKPYRDKYFEKLGVFYKDNYISIKLYIAENDKPKNKYSLLAYGKCKFPQKLLEYPYSYGLPTNDSGCDCNIRTLIKDFPIKEELKVYVKRNRGRILDSFLGRYNYVRDEYLTTINNYSLNDFKDVFKVKNISEIDAKVVCIVDRSEWRLFNDFYYIGDKKIEGNPLDYIRVNGKLFKRYCRKELMMITQTGNTLFGNWWSMRIEPYSHRDGIQFTRENYEKTLNEALQFVDSRNKNRRGEKVDFRYPKVKWVNDNLLNNIERTLNYL